MAKPGHLKGALRSKSPSNFGIAGCIDVETTGLYPGTDEVVELGLVLFSYNPQTGDLLEMVESYSGLREPACPIGAAALRVHGLTADKLKGKVLDSKKVLAMMGTAHFLISHNASFDYGFVKQLFPETTKMPWYCSMKGIDWYSKGFSSRGLQNLLTAHGIEVARSHRALDDARAVLALLARDNTQGQSYFSELIKGGPLFRGI